MNRKQRTICFASAARGLSLIEVLLAMAILAIGFMAVGSLVMTTAKNTTTGHMLTEATMLARDKIEYLKSLPLDHLGIECSDETGPELINGIYERDCDASRLDTSTTAKIITVTVKWRKLNKARRVVLQTSTRGRGL